MPDTPPPDLPALAVAWLDALLGSASVDTIGVTNWWPRATSALVTAAATADSYGHAVSTACRKLQIDVLSAHSAKALADLEPQIGPHLAQWQALAERDAEYLVALTRVHRQAKSAARKTKSTVVPDAPAATAAEATF